MINAIVIVVTMFAFAFLVWWMLHPSFRKWVEAPKYTMLEKEEQYRETYNTDRDH
jgi:hypothetical protein